MSDLIYAAGFVVTCVMWGLMVSDSRSITMCRVTGVVFALVWPVTLPCMAGYGIITVAARFNRSKEQS